LKSYLEVKKTNTPLIGSIPISWSLLTIRRIITGHKQGFYSTEDYSEKGVKLLRISDLSETGLISYDEAPHVNIDENTYKAYEVKMGDFLFPRTGSIGLIGYQEQDIPSVFASYLIRFRFRSNISTQYLKYYLTSYPFKQELLSDLHGGVNQNIHAENIKNRHLVVPSHEEQTQIAQYLEYKTSLIDKLIEKNEKLIKLLEEQRSAIINQAVTKGLNPDVKMKDSGMEWIGKIPEHWEVKKLKYLIKDKLMYGANEPAIEENVAHPRYIRITDFGDKGELNEKTFKSLDPDKAQEYSLSEGDILFARSGATVGKVFQFINYKGQACFAGYLIKASPNTKIIDTNFLYLYTQSAMYNNWKNSILTQATIQNIGADKYSTLYVTFPTLIEEQNQIARYLQNKTSLIDKLVEEKRKTNEYLKEYRTTLISNVVTGKIDVRDEKIPESLN